MKLKFGCFVVALLDIAISQGVSEIIRDDNSVVLSRDQRELRDLLPVGRSLPDSPSGGYAPAKVACPASRPTVRAADSLSDEEQAWLKIRRPNTVAPMIDLLTRANIPDFNASAYISGIAGNISALPNIGLGISGGAYRALFNAAGFLAAIDSRTPGSTDQGQLGGLLQSSSYLCALSGGSWAAGSFIANNFTPIVDLRDSPSNSPLWKFDSSILTGPTAGGIPGISTIQYYASISASLAAKQAAGFFSNVLDFWGLAFGFQLINGPDGGGAFTYSSTSEIDLFKNGEMPFPILVATSRNPGDVNIKPNASVIEINVFETGSWDPTLGAFAPTEFLGSNFDGGVVPSNGSCVQGFSSVDFCMGASSNFLSQFIAEANLKDFIPPGIPISSLPSFIQEILNLTQQEAETSELIVARFAPTPFQNFNPTGQSVHASEPELQVFDGGDGGESIPFSPMIQHSRGLDVIFAIDSDNDTPLNWPNGSALTHTFNRQFISPLLSNTSFPSIPDTNTFVNLGLNSRPTFFGCNSSNSTNPDLPTPLIVYLPMAPYNTFPNLTLTQLTTSDSDRNALIENGYNVVTQGNGTLDSEWPICVACAILSRSLERTGTTVPSKCEECFNRYCYNGTIDTSTPPTYSPDLLLKNEGSGGGNGSATSASGSGNGTQPSGTTMPSGPATSPPATTNSGNGKGAIISKICMTLPLLCMLAL